MRIKAKNNSAEDNNGKKELISLPIDWRIWDERRKRSDPLEKIFFDFKKTKGLESTERAKREKDERTQVIHVDLRRLNEIRSILDVDWMERLVGGVKKRKKTNEWTEGWGLSWMNCQGMFLLDWIRFQINRWRRNSSHWSSRVKCDEWEDSFLLSFEEIFLRYLDNSIRSVKKGSSHLLNQIAEENLWNVPSVLQCPVNRSISFLHHHHLTITDRSNVQMMGNQEKEINLWNTRRVISFFVEWFMKILLKISKWKDHRDDKWNWWMDHWAREILPLAELIKSIVEKNFLQSWIQRSDGESNEINRKKRKRNCC